MKFSLATLTAMLAVGVIAAPVDAGEADVRSYTRSSEHPPPPGGAIVYDPGLSHVVKRSSGPPSKEGGEKEAKRTEAVPCDEKKKNDCLAKWKCDGENDTGPNFLQCRLCEIYTSECAAKGPQHEGPFLAGPGIPPGPA
ncbi:uncharacterized protein UV8b_06846 [Ustilaginoidea virens]|uniref:Uncharacterized protein n=1 Tax=Ustilaginoidea virens TaxID=1159556 RepID=A0A8E5HWC2_USTVR|nr:uncharacterized protein UV8b_06846 [Ustilaginoidea virens]QUC22605.1 hypothetical protein UV8b_06846 [Ustilaginoidea virens]